MEFSNRRLSAHSQSRYAWQFGSDPHTVDVPLKNPTRFDDWIPNETRFNDGALITIAPGRCEPNAWGLSDMHGYGRGVHSLRLRGISL